MITLQWVYALAAAMFLAFAAINLRDAGHPHRFGNAVFWALMALGMGFGDRLGDFGNGLVVLALVALGGSGRVGARHGGEVPASVRQARAGRFGSELFLIALTIPLVALIGTLAFRQMPRWIEAKQATLIALALGVLVALGWGYARLRPRAIEPFAQGRRLMDAVGWAAILPQMLASLGAVFALAGVGHAVGDLVQMALPGGSRIGAVIVYGCGMALFTMVMGNAFAAFPVMIAGVGLPLLIQRDHADPAAICAIGMLAGFCGTLMTPMAANFNIVPAALLGLTDRNLVIRRQIGTALPLLVFNIVLIALFAFPKA